MKKVLMLIAVVLGTTVMVNAQTTPAKVQAKEVKSEKHKAEKKAKAAKAEVKTDAKAAKAEVKTDAKTTKAVVKATPAKVEAKAAAKK